MNAVIQANTLGVHFNQFLYPDVIAGGGPMAVWYRVHAPVITNNFGPFYPTHRVLQTELR